MSQLSKEQQQLLVSLLQQLEPGFLPFEIFVQIARLTVLSIIEFVPLKMNDSGEAEVLLLKRAKDDILWPSELHVPGTVIRPTDTAGKLYLAFERILHDELESTKVSLPHFVGNVLHESKRGMEQAQVYWVEVLGEPQVGTFYTFKNLPENFMKSQEKFVAQAIQNFTQAKSRG